MARWLQAENFQLAWEKVAENQGCAGVDGETIAAFARRADRALAELRQAVATGQYRPLPLRQIFIPKQAGKWRELGVPTVRDRIVQQALLNVLHPILEPQFEACSFAYRPGRSHLLAVEQVANWRDRGYQWVLDADITSYFDNVDHERLLAEFAERLRVKSHHPKPSSGAAATPPSEQDLSQCLDLIRGWIGAGVLTAEGIVLRQKGLPQGAVISPILANVFLDDLDEHLTQQGFPVVRYADDFVVFAKTEAQILAAYTIVADLLATMQLALHPDKTRVTNFDRGFRFLGHIFTGGLIVKAKVPDRSQTGKPKSSGLRLVHTEPALRPTAMELALVEALKQAQRPIPPPLFVVLGYQVRSPESVVIRANYSQPETWRAEMPVVYLTQQGTVVKEVGDRFVVQVPQEEPLELLIREIEQILVFGQIQLTAAVISSCLVAQIPIVFLTQLGEYKGHLYSAERSDLVLQTAQFGQRVEFQVQTARAIVQAKLWNSRQLLVRLNRQRQVSEVAAAIAGLISDSESLGQVAEPTLEQIRGYEGAGAARYFAALGQLITNPGFEWTGRSFHPPQDPINSLLSFGYTLLLNNVVSLILAEGLNPQLGNLHGTERQKAFLAFDLMEEWRSVIVDTLVMDIVNHKVLRPTDFTWATAEGGIYLTRQARRIFLKRFEDRISSLMSHPDVQSQVSYRRAMQLQVKRYAKAILGNSAYEPFRRIK